ncbi:MAG: MarR family winged helix-turn-helix transcriptional regulator [Desulfotomaculales bacterium]
MQTRHELLIELLQEVNRGFREHIRGVLDGYKLPVAAMTVLKMIREEPGITVSELARRTGFAKSNVSNMIDWLGRQGWVEKRTDRADQRILRLYLTDSAAGFLTAIKAEVRRRIGDLVSGIPENRTGELIEGLREVHEALKKAKEKEEGKGKEKEKERRQWG